MPNFDIENFSFKNNTIMIGVDEAGRGSWAGPLVASACWIDFKYYQTMNPHINDSKKLTPLKRKQIIYSLDDTVKYSSAVSSQREIDHYGLTFANTMAMKRSIFSLIENMNLVSKKFLNNYNIYVDGKYKPNFDAVDEHLSNKKLNIKYKDIIPLVKGDTISKTIALASIIAKETRDEIMKQYSLKYPKYSFDSHFGYGTAKHREEILKYGVLKEHRKSFQPINTIYSQKIS